MSLFKSMEDLPDKVETKEMPKFSTVELSTKTFLEQLRNINSCTDDEIKDIICRQYTTFLDYDLFLANPESRRVAQEMFTNERFLKNLLEVVTMLPLNNQHKICCNKLAYDYMAYHSNDADPMISGLLMDLSFRVNTDMVLALAPIVNVEPAKYIAMLYKSSFREEICITRLNRYLIRSGLELREQHMIDIYSKLFERVSTLFIVTMMEVPDEDFDKLERYRYDEMSKCMIDILDSMPSAEIKNVLENYSVTYFLKGEPPVRFSMLSLHDSYKRIKDVIKYLAEEGTIVP